MVSTSTAVEELTPPGSQNLAPESRASKPESQDSNALSEAGSELSFHPKLRGSRLEMDVLNGNISFFQPGIIPEGFDAGDSFTRQKTDQSAVLTLTGVRQERLGSIRFANASPEFTHNLVSELLSADRMVHSNAEYITPDELERILTAAKLSGVKMKTDGLGNSDPISIANVYRLKLSRKSTHKPEQPSTKTVRVYSPSKGEPECFSSLEDVLNQLQSDNPPTWIDIEAPDHKTLRIMQEELGLDPEHLKDCARLNRSSRLDKSRESFFVGTNLFEVDPYEPKVVKETEFNVFLHGNTLITLHPSKISFLKEITTNGIPESSSELVQAIFTSYEQKLYDVTQNLAHKMLDIHRALDEQVEKPHELREKIQRALELSQEIISSIEWQQQIPESLECLSPGTEEELQAAEHFRNRLSDHIRALDRVSSRCHLFLDELNDRRVERFEGLSMDLNHRANQSNEIMKKLTQFVAVATPYYMALDVTMKHLHNLLDKNPYWLPVPYVIATAISGGLLYFGSKANWWGSKGNKET